MNRRFNRRQRRVLAWVAGGYCKRCNERLLSHFHADHIVPYSKGGETVTNNGQALCSRCNLEKGSQWNSS